MQETQLFKTITIATETLIAVGLTGVIYYWALFGANRIALSSGRPITSQQQMEDELIETKYKMGCTANIVAKLVDHPEGGCRKEGDHYYMELGGRAANTKGLEHEVYHIYKGHADHKNSLAYFFWYEPRTVFYSLTGK